MLLSADLYLPGRGETHGRGGAPGRGGSFGAVLNMDPYRKDDWSAGWDRSLAAFLNEHGFAYCRLDVRGTGSSHGVALDEYTDAETRDGYDAVEWLAARPWSNGRVGMWGLSYGGFTSLQVACLRPPHLAAIVALQATDDRYTDDVHYVGGAMTVSELAQYAVSQVAMNAMPPLPEAWGGDWRDRWRERLEATPPWLFEWARRQRDGGYWRRGSVAPGYERISAAILQFAGWMDEYVDAALRIQARCTGAAERRTIVGPWVHGLPDHAYAGPNVDWLGESIRWFDRWLGEAESGAAGEAVPERATRRTPERVPEPDAEREPELLWFQREFTPPERFPARLAGSWRSLGTWEESGPTLSLSLDGGVEPGRGRLAAEPPTGSGADRLRHHPTAGSRAGSLCWGAGHPPNGLAADLRDEEGLGPTYTSDPLTTPIDVLGRAVAILHVTSSEPIAHLVVRLGDVERDGAVEQVSEGILNLTHRDSHAEPTPLEPGRTYEVRVPLRAAGYRFLPGHRIRLSVASAHWPVIWPSPGAARLAILRGPATPSRLELPLAPAAASAVPPGTALLAEPPALREFGSEAAESPSWEIVEDGPTGTVTVRTREASTSILPDGRSTLHLAETLAMAASEHEPGSGRFEHACTYRLERDGIRVDVRAEGSTVADAEAFDMAVRLTVDLDGEPFWARDWRERITRDLL